MYKSRIEYCQGNLGNRCIRHLRIIVVLCKCIILEYYNLRIILEMFLYQYYKVSINEFVQ